MKFHGGRGRVWAEIDSHLKSKWKKAGRKRRTGRPQIFAAISYVTEPLPMEAGDVLIVDLSLHAVRSGATNPRVLIPLLDRGVDIRMHPDLHAKVILIGGRRLYVGSMNSSDASRARLVEAAVETTDREALLGAAGWLKALAGDATTVTRSKLKALALEFNPGLGGARGPARDAPDTGNRRRRPKFWLLVTNDDDLRDGESAARKEREGPREPHLQGMETSVLESAASWRSAIEPGDFVIEVDARSRPIEVYRAGEVWDVEVNKTLRCRQVSIAHRSRDLKHPIPWPEFQKLARQAGTKKASRVNEYLLPDAVAQRLMASWPR
jgi:hypothetical protein